MLCNPCIFVRLVTLFFFHYRTLLELSALSREVQFQGFKNKFQDFLQTAGIFYIT